MNSIKGFNYSILTLTLFIAVIILHIIEELASVKFTSLYGFILIGIIISVIIGSIYSFKGRNEIYSTRKFIGKLLNVGYTVFFLF